MIEMLLICEVFVDVVVVDVMVVVLVLVQAGGGGGKMTMVFRAARGEVPTHPQRHRDTPTHIRQKGERSSQGGTRTAARIPSSPFELFGPSTRWNQYEEFSCNFANT
jgi:hypothetical protein